MAKKFELHVRLDVDAIVQVTAENFEDALEQGRKLRSEDVIKVPQRIIVDNIDVFVQGVMKA